MRASARDIKIGFPYVCVDGLPWIQTLILKAI